MNFRVSPNCMYVKLGAPHNLKEKSAASPPRAVEALLEAIDCRLTPKPNRFRNHSELLHTTRAGEPEPVFLAARSRSRLRK